MLSPTFSLRSSVASLALFEAFSNASLIGLLGKDQVTIINSGPTADFFKFLHDKDVSVNSDVVTQEVIDEQLPTGVSFKVERSRIQDLFKINTPIKPEDDPSNAANVDSTSSDVKTRFFGLLSFSIPVVHNYGCWCFGGRTWPGPREAGKGRGNSQDVYDDNCMTHATSYDCIKLDNRVNRMTDKSVEECLPVETTYDLGIVPAPGGGYTLGCANPEEQWCQRRTCQVDMQFMARIWALEVQGMFPDYVRFGHLGFHHDSGTFDVDENCGSLKTTVLPTTVASATTEAGSGNGIQPSEDEELEALLSVVPEVKVCCGDYPFRVWHNLNNDQDMNCCMYEDDLITQDYGFAIRIGQEYDSKNGTCCADGVREVC